MVVIIYIFVSGGKTMGHISPLLGIIFELKNKYDFVYFGLENSMEEEICKRYNISFYKMHLTPFYRRNIFKNIKTFFYIFKESKIIKKIYKDFDVKAVISSGGFVSIPLILSVKSKKKILLESNSTLGLANKCLSYFVNYIGIQFDSIRHKKSIVLGNPIKIYEPKFDHLWFYKKEKIILFVGGSNGAFDIVKLAYEFNQKYPDVKIFVITGERYYNTFVFNKNAAFFKKIFELSSVLNKFDLVISRAGASTITELLVSNTPFILVPSPNVSGNHQVYNAKYLEKQGVCDVIYDIDFDENITFINQILHNNTRLETMKNNQRKIQIKDSLKRVVELIEKV